MWSTNLIIVTFVSKWLKCIILIRIFKIYSEKINCISPIDPIIFAKSKERNRSTEKLYIVIIVKSKKSKKPFKLSKHIHSRRTVGKIYTPLSIILLNRRNVDIFPYCKKSANIYLHKSNIPNLKLGILDLCSENIPNLEIRNIGFM